MGRRTGTGFGVRWSPWAGSQPFGSMRGTGESFHINQRLPDPAVPPARGPGGRERRTDAATAPSSARMAVALIQADKCAGCGICVDVCPTGALRVDGHALVDPGLCTACAACVGECPTGAVIIVQRSA
jgi:NAD-dependent dihydropyrimidine dehydrogenase PreA subunit